MTRAERVAWEQKRDQYEEPLIAKARRAGTIPVIDCTAKKYPVPPHVLPKLYAAQRLLHPDAREPIYRAAALLRRKAGSLRSLAVVLERDGKGAKAEDMRAKALQHEADADAAELSTTP